MSLSDFGAEIDALSLTFEAAAGARHRVKVDRLVDGDQQIGARRGS